MAGAPDIRAGLLFVWFGVLSGMHWWSGEAGYWGGSWGHMYPWSPWVFPFMGLFWGFGGLVWLFLGLFVAFFVYSDASRRYPRDSLAPLAWAVGVVFGGLLVLLIYLLVRPSGERREEMKEKGEGRG